MGTEIDSILTESMLIENPKVVGVDLEPAFGIYAEIDLIIDTTNTDDIPASVDAFVDHFDDKWSVYAESLYIPKKLPVQVDLHYRNLDSSAIEKNKDEITELFSQHLDVPE